LNAFIAAALVEYLGAFVRQHALGYVFGADAGYDIAPGYTPVPDVSFISRARSPQFPQGNATVPDLVVEVISPSETPRAITTKTERYLQAGVQQVWNIYPPERVIEIWQIAADGSYRMQPLTDAQPLTGGDLLPGFAVPVRDLFPEA
jgi:Uma2 family endonuclease